MYELKKLERYLRVNLLGLGPRFIKKKNLRVRGLTKVEKHWARRSGDRISVGAKFSARVQTDPGVHPVSCTICTLSLSRDKAAGACCLPHNPV